LSALPAGAGQIWVEGKGRVSPHEAGRAGARRCESVARGMRVNWLLLQKQQHKTCDLAVRRRRPSDRCAAGIQHEPANMRRRPLRAAAASDCPSKGRRLISLARPPAYLEGAVQDEACRARTRHNRNSLHRRTLHTAGISQWQARVGRSRKPALAARATREKARPPCNTGRL